MGTISEKLTYLNETKQLLKDKINNLGGSIDEHTTFRQYANQLQNVYDNLPKTEYQEGTEVNLGKTIKGKLDYDNGVVGIGQTEQDSTNGYNLYNANIQSRTENGLTITSLGKGIYKVNGTATADLSTALNDEFMQVSGTFRVSGCPSGGSASTYMLSAYVGYWGGGSPNIDTGSGTNITYTGNFKLRLYIKSGTVCNNLIFKPMVTTDLTKNYADYEPYTGGLPAPNPSYPQTINSVTGNQDVVVSGKNLFSSMLEVGTFTNSGLNNTSTNRLRSKDYIAVQPNTTYTMSVTNNTTYTLTASVSFYNKNDFTTPRTGYLNWSTGNVLTFETPSDCTYIRTLFNLENSTISADRITNAMLEKGNQATTYEPYITPTSYQLSLGDIELNAIGNYKDYIWTDRSTGKWYKRNKCMIKRLTTFSNQPTDTTNIRRWQSANIGTSLKCDLTTGILAYLNIGKLVLEGKTYSRVEGFTINNNVVYIYFEEFNSFTVQEMNTYASQNEIMVAFPLDMSNETDTEITDTTLINQLEEWYNSHSFNGTTIITSNGDLPMIIKVRALKGE